MSFWTILDGEGAPVVMQVESAVAPDPAIYGGVSAVELGGPMDPATSQWSGAAWVSDLPALKAMKGEAIKARRDAAEHAGCTTDYGPIDTDADSQRKIGGASTMALALGAAFTMDWRMADNSIVTLDASQMIAVGLAVAQRIATCQARKNELDAAIAAATDLTALNAIDIDTGWPS